MLIFPLEYMATSEARDLNILAKARKQRFKYRPVPVEIREVARKKRVK